MMMQASWMNAIKGKLNVYRAIILREVRVRYASRRLGYLWAVLEPLIHIAVYIALFTALERASPVDQPLAVFFATSILPWILFTGTIHRVSRAVEANRALLSYPHIAPVDFMLMRAVLESATLLTVTVMMGLAAHAIYGFNIADPLPMLGAWFTISILGCGIGMINAIITSFFETYDNFFKPFMQFVYFTSGIFFVVSDLPSAAQAMLLWNPMLHLIDWFRSGALIGYHGEFHQPLPLIGTALAFFLSGIMVERLRRRELRTP